MLLTDKVINLLSLAAVLGHAGIVALVLLYGYDKYAKRRFAFPDAIVRFVSQYALPLAWGMALISTVSSLFFSEFSHFEPCMLCWYQRIFMYPLAITTLVAGLFNDHRAARYLLPLPVIGAGVSIYHLLVENGVVEQTQACLVSAPGGCATKWIDKFGYVTIPTLALTAFALTFAFLLFALLDSDRTATVNADA